MCGENYDDEIEYTPGWGSSPRVRGKLIDGHAYRFRVRLIPACAGKTVAIRHRRRLPRAHPRVCGENLSPSFFSRALLGSSPRVRGKLPQHPAHVLDSGLIPACAGKTSSWARWSSSDWAYPRVCGENLPIEKLPSVDTGLSPRVRGKLEDFILGQLRGRIIPACAGKTTTTQRSQPRSPAHPRVCGENSANTSRTASASGSSPRVRGKRRSVSTWKACCGLIPAHAGKTQVSCAGSRGLWAHPRACGENKISGGNHG